MQDPICPKCGQQGRLLAEISKAATVDYYRCDACNHVWNYDRGDPDAPRRDVTERSGES